jgi:RNA polymerase sigma-70 factor, ECF subfamily
VTRVATREVFERVKSDSELTRAARSGDGSAFELLAERYYAACLRYAQSQLGQREDAEEAVQDAMVRAFRALLRGAAPESFRPWLLRIVVNRCRSMGARRTRRRRLFAHWLARSAPGTSEDPPEIADDMDPLLAGALASLKPMLREAFLLKHVEELTYEQMMAVTGASESALKMRVKRAAEQLAAKLRDHSGRDGKEDS